MRFFKPYFGSRERRFHCFCIGAAKTGTTTLVSCFKPHFSAAHEPEPLATNAMVIDYLEKMISRNELVETLQVRDRRLNLELESAHPLAYLSGVLADAFPSAKFLVTIREPLSWLKSRLQFHYRTNPPDWVPYREYFWQRRHGGYAPEERELEQYGLFSLDTYLSQYADHYRRVFLEVPENRRLLVLTSDINAGLPRIAGFLGLPASSFRIKHRKQSKPGIQPIDALDPDYVRGRIQRHCGDLLNQCFVP